MIMSINPKFTPLGRDCKGRLRAACLPLSGAVACFLMPTAYAQSQLPDLATTTNYIAANVGTYASGIQSGGVDADQIYFHGCAMHIEASGLIPTMDGTRSYRRTEKIDVNLSNLTWVEIFPESALVELDSTPGLILDHSETEILSSHQMRAEDHDAKALRIWFKNLNVMRRVGNAFKHAWDICKSRRHSNDPFDQPS